MPLKRKSGKSTREGGYGEACKPDEGWAGPLGITPAKEQRKDEGQIEEHPKG